MKQISDMRCRFSHECQGENHWLLSKGAAAKGVLLLNTAQHHTNIFRVAATNASFLGFPCGDIPTIIFYYSNANNHLRV